MKRLTRVATDDGSWTIHDELVGQACHSLAGAWTEARERYARPCELRRKAKEDGVLRLLDVGTGIGWNLAAALAELEEESVRLEVLCLEADRKLFEFGAECLVDDTSGGAVWLERARRALAASLDQGEAVPLECGGALRFVIGDARRTLAKEPAHACFDAVFLDPFSPGTAPGLWEASFLREVAQRIASGGLLSTYTTSLEVRARLVCAGLEVGSGPRVGTKHQGTIAGRDVSLGPLEARTQRKLARRVERQLRDANVGTIDRVELR